MRIEAELRLHGAADGEADVLQGGEEGKGVGCSSPRRQEEDARVSSSRSPSAVVAGDLSFRSSGAWSTSSFSSQLAPEVESDDDGDGAYPWTQCEYEEIPPFRWIASPLRWWKPKKQQTRSKTNDHGMRMANQSVVLFFDEHPVFTAEDLVRAPTEILGTGAYGSLHKLTLLGDLGHQLVMRRLSSAVADKFGAEEAQALGKIRHPNILALRAYCSWPQGGDQKALVFDYMPRGSLQSAFLQGDGPVDAISMPERMKIAIEIARGLHHLHTRCNMVHGNLTSRNILLDDDDGDDVKIADYGLPGDHLAAAAAGASDQYRAPELPTLEKPNAKTDVYSLGAIILELLTDVDDPDPLCEVVPTLRTALDSTRDLAWRCMDSSPFARPVALDVLRQLDISVGAIGRDKAAQRGLGTKPSKPQKHSSPFARPVALDMLRRQDITARVLGYRSRQQVIGHPGIAAHSEDDRRFAPTSKTEEISTESATPMSGHIGDPVTVSPTLEGYRSATRGGRRTLELSDQDDHSAESERTDATDHMPSRSGTGINPALPRIDWSKLENVQVDQLQVPPSTSPVPLISSEPDLIYQSYFLTLHKLANTSPPLPSDALEGQLNRMLVGLHSMGYPLDVWTKAASLLLVSAKKREHIERYVDDYKVRLDVQVGEFTSAVNLVKEDVSRIQSDLSALEQRNQELDETIGGLKLEQEKVVGELTVARDQLASAEAKAESMSMDMDRAKQQRSATSQLRDEMLQQLPSVDQVFDSAFQEIMAKKF